MLKYFFIISIFFLQAEIGFAQDSTKTRYAIGDSLLSDSAEKVLSMKYYGREALDEKKFSIKGNRKDTAAIYNYSYHKYADSFEVLEVAIVYAKEQYVETYFSDNKILLTSRMRMLTDSTGKMEQPWESEYYFLNGNPVYGWSIGTPLDENMGMQILMLYGARRRELEKRL